MSITESIKEQLKAIAVSVDVNINSMLNMLTTEQLEQVIEYHNHIKFKHPQLRAKMILCGLRLSGSKWLFEFIYDNVEFHAGPYQAHDLDIQDVISFMGTCENCLIPA